MADSKISFEFFPPRSEAQRLKFTETFQALEALRPEYASITWGALGTSSQASIDLLGDLIKTSKIPLASHLTCVGHTEQSMQATIAQLEGLGIKRFVALRGDKPDDAPNHAKLEKGELQHASQLVELLAQNSQRDISVAAYPESHPEATSDDQDILWLKHKLDNGAQRAITQFFFSADTYLRFRDRAVAAGITQELVPGILPINNIDKVMQFSAQCGAHVPAGLVERFGKATDEQAAEDCAVEQCVELVQTLEKEGVKSFHLYTLNQAQLSERVFKHVLGHSVDLLVPRDFVAA